MAEQHKIEKSIYIAKIELPVNIIMYKAAVACAAQVGQILSFSDSDQYHLEFAVEEAFGNAVEHYSRVAGEAERICIEFYISENYLVISICENGIPFDFKESERYTPDSLESMGRPGLGMFLMEQGMDSVEQFVHGREGKETRLKKKIKYGAIPDQLLHAQSRIKRQKRVVVKKSCCREALIEDLPEICRLAWRCYGYTQEELLYNLELLTDKYKNGEVKPIVFFDPESGNMIAHEALKYHDESVKVGELGLAFIDPAYRCPKQTVQFAEEALKVAKANGDSGMFDCSVTTHIFSQKAMQEYVGSRPCSVFFGIAAAGMQAQELTTTKQEKGSVVNHYYAFDRSAHKVFVTARHKDIIAKIYGWLELPRTIEYAEAGLPVGESSVSIFPLPDELNVVFIVVHDIGGQTVREIANGLRLCRHERRDVVFAFLPLGVEHSPYLVEECEKLGFSFAGIMPHIHGGDDRIILQFVDIALDINKIKVYGEMSRELLDYVWRENISIRER